VIRRLFHMLAGTSNSSDLSVPFAVKCPAGHVVRGCRQRRYQIVKCPECAEDVFVLARSPFVARHQLLATTQSAGRSSPWRRPLVAAAITLIFVGGALGVLLFALAHEPEVILDPRMHIAAADVALKEGKLGQAVEEFNKARELSGQQAGLLTAAERRTLYQRQREVSLLADLLQESLEEILAQAERSPAEEWKAQFEKRYRRPGQANAVVFDAEIRRDGAGQYHLDWILNMGKEPARLEIGNLQVLHDLPLEQPRRLLFGARLESIAREQDGVWVVRFEATSAVLLTDPLALAASHPEPLDNELMAVLEQQRNWIEGK
jgi:hypothetical protein